VIARSSRASEIADIRGDIVRGAWGTRSANMCFTRIQMVQGLRYGRGNTDVQG